MLNLHQPDGKRRMPDLFLNLHQPDGKRRIPVSILIGEMQKGQEQWLESGVLAPMSIPIRSFLVVTRRIC
jgi:hypothetical protein